MMSRSCSLRYKSIVLLWLLPLLVASESSTLSSPFSIVIDGGSTGSRLHVFEFVQTSNSTTANVVECVRRGSTRVDTPLSAFGRIGPHSPPVSSTEVALHLLPLFEYAAKVIPPQYHAATPTTYQATAGMRLLSEENQQEVYDAAYKGLSQQPSFVFVSLERSDIATLAGDLEGFYGAVAANYLEGVIDASLHTIGDGSQSHGPLGALDMGGSSTQIVFQPQQEANNACLEQQQDADESCPNVDVTLPSRLRGDDFFSTSYLSYGADQFRERLWSTWVHERRKTQVKDSCDSRIIDNPCTFKGYEIEWEGYTLLGTGDAHECVEQVRRLIPHHENVHHAHEADGNKVGGVEHPPLRGKFFAMSLYFFTLDSLRELSKHEQLNVSWPTPSIEELFHALDGLCSRSWKGDLEDIKHEAHAYTRPEVLPHRCLESVYMVTLLRDGFGFHPHSRDITFTFLVNDSEVEWSLGMALVQHAKQHDAAVSSSSSQETAGADDSSNNTKNNVTLEQDATTKTTTTLENHHYECTTSQTCMAIFSE